MPLLAVQTTLVAATPAALMTTAGFNNVTGTVAEPLFVSIKNEDASAIVWIGGSNVSPTHGQSLGPGATMQLELRSGDIPYAYCAAATPIISVIAGLQ
jgi:hypothetical protein